MGFARNVQILVILSAAIPVSALSADFNVSLLGGYKGGASVKVGGMVSNFAQGFPLSLEAAAAYTWRDPGNAVDARRIFVNDNTDGTPQKSGDFWDLRLDFLYRVKALGLQDLSLYAGVRYSMFSGDFEYIGGNEDFNVTTDQFGIGIGAKVNFPIGSRLALTIAGGLDQYFAASLYGHDTTYSPDDQNINSKHDYTFSTADEAINQPKLVPLLLIGLTYTL